MIGKVYRIGYEYQTWKRFHREANRMTTFNSLHQRIAWQRPLLAGDRLDDGVGIDTDRRWMNGARRPRKSRRRRYAERRLQPANDRQWREQA
jgi:hypothetical protein